MGDTTRRQALAAATIGAATLALSQPAGAQTSSSGQARGGKQDPRSKYPKPPFKAQTQPWPGLASQMDSAARPRRDLATSRFRSPARTARHSSPAETPAWVAPPPSPTPAKAPMSPSTTSPPKNPTPSEVKELIRKKAGRKAVAHPRRPPRPRPSAKICSSNRAISGARWPRHHRLQRRRASNQMENPSST